MEGCGENGEAETSLTESTEGQEKVASQEDNVELSTKKSTESLTDRESASKADS